MRRAHVRMRLRKSPVVGFTIVELLIVIVILGVLATIVIVAYSGVQERARSAKRQNDIAAVQKIVEAYNAEKGEYPKTSNDTPANWRSIDVQTDDNCQNGSSTANWIPGVSAKLPQSDVSSNKGVDGLNGCYLYASNGTFYVLSAWNMVSSPQTSTMYRRLGFREFQSSSSTQFYTCNSNTVGGASGGYDITQDYYKHSYTISNITNCDETPPNGA